MLPSAFFTGSSSSISMTTGVSVFSFVLFCLFLFLFLGFVPVNPTGSSKIFPCTSEDVEGLLVASLCGAGCSASAVVCVGTGSAATKLCEIVTWFEAGALGGAFLPAVTAAKERAGLVVFICELGGFTLFVAVGLEIFLAAGFVF